MPENRRSDWLIIIAIVSLADAPLCPVLWAGQKMSFLNVLSTDHGLGTECKTIAFKPTEFGI